MASISMDDVMRQLADLNQRLNEEIRLRQQAESELRQLKEERNTPMPDASLTNDTMPKIPPPQPLAAQPRPPKVATPDKYDGSKGSKAEIFLNQLGVYLQLNSSVFTNDHARIAFALSYTSGKANLWGQHIMDQMLDSERGQLVTWSKFIESFKATFFDSERIGKAERQMRALKQVKDVSDYWIKFSELSLVVKWPEEVLISQFEQGLKSEITVHMIRDEFETVEEMAKMAIKLDSKIHKRNPESNSHLKSSQTVSPTVDPDAMDCSAYRLNITEDEYNRRCTSGACVCVVKLDTL
jgi:hypothetical protein